MADLEKLLCAELKRQIEAKGPVTPAIPAGGDLLWKWFMALHRTRQSGFGGPQSIQFGEIEAYNRLMGEGIEPRHVKILLAMDQTYLAAVHRKSPQVPEGVQAMAPVSETPLSAGMFDAIFGGR